MSDTPIEIVDITTIVPDAHNANLGTERGDAMLEESLSNLGAGRSILLDRHGRIIAGNKTAMKAGQLGMDRVIVVESDGQSIVAVKRMDLDLEGDGKARQLAYADNRVAEADLEWDFKQIAKDVQEGLDLSAFFMPEELEAALRAEVEKTGPLHDDDELLINQCEERVAVGDLWRLGPHVLVCGDCTKADQVERCLDGARPDLMVTDPPYGVNYTPVWRDELFGESRRGRATNLITNDMNAVWSDAYALFPGNIAYIWCASTELHVVVPDLQSVGFELRSHLIWVKHHFTISRGHYHWKHEPCLYMVRKGGTAQWKGDRAQTTVWDDIEDRLAATRRDGDDTTGDAGTGHSTQKPQECMARPIRHHTDPGDHVYDPFVGSGTTLLASEKLGRVCHAMDIEPRCCDLAMTRWEMLTGLKAVKD